MNTMQQHPDFAAFVAKITAARAAGITLEKREAPEATAVDLSKLTATIDKITDGIEAFKSGIDARLDKVETRIARPGAMLPAKGGDGASDAPVWMVKDKPVRLLRNVGDIEHHYTGLGGPEIKAGDFFRGVANLSCTPEAKAVLSVGTDADGGYMVPSAVMRSVLAAMMPESTCLTAGAMIMPIGGPNDGFKTMTVAATDTVPTAAWRSENGGVTESSPGFRAVVITPRSLSFYFKVSRELLMDAAGLDPALMTAIAQAFAKELDRAALRGSGTAPEPRGVGNSTSLGVNAVANGANGASLATTRYANLFSAAQAILEDDAPMPTAAIMSPRSRVVLGQLADTTNQPMQVPPMLQGMRFLSTSQIPNNLTVGSSTDCSEIHVGDFRRMVFAMREQMSVQMLNEVFATNGQVGFICHVRCDIVLLYPKAFAIVTGVRP